jgi:hypothetical protein
MRALLRWLWVSGLLAFGFVSLGAAPVATHPPAGFRLIIELQDGSKIIGKNGDDHFQFRSEVLGEMKLPLGRIRTITCQSKTNWELLTTTNGDTLTVQFVTKAVRVETAFGGVKLPVDLIRRLTVSPAGKPDRMRDGLVALWPGDGNADDVIGTNNGTLTPGASYAAGKAGQAFLLDGTGGYVSIPDSPSLDTFVSSITVEAWIKINPLAVNTDWKGIVTKGNSSWWLQAWFPANTVYVAFAGLRPKMDMFGTRNINDGQWHHVAAVYDGTKMFLYVDGLVDASQPATGLIAQNNDPVCIGANAKAFVPRCGCNQTGYFFNGLIDEVSLYNRALTASEIQADYEAGKDSD